MEWNDIAETKYGSIIKALDKAYPDTIDGLPMLVAIGRVTITLKMEVIFL